MANLRRYENSPVITWDPFDIMREVLNLEPAAARPSRQAFAPQFEVKETKEGYSFKADLPGVKEKDLELSLTGNRLTISGKREAEEHQAADTYYAYERSFGTFSRTFTLPADVDDEHVHADLKEGVLTLMLPKKPEHQPKKISLKSAVDKVIGKA